MKTQPRAKKSESELRALMREMVLAHEETMNYLVGLKFLINAIPAAKIIRTPRRK